MRQFAGVVPAIVIVGALACSGDPEILDPCDQVGVSCRAPQLDAAALFSETCSACHSLQLPMAASITQPDEAWALLRQMNDHGLILTAKEQWAIAEYLCARNTSNVGG